MKRPVFLPSASLATAAVLLVASGCDLRPATDPVAVKPTDTAVVSKEKPVVERGTLLTDVTDVLGIQNPKGPWPDGKFQTPEITPGGVALFDYNNDGRLDIYQICHCAPGSFTDPAPNRLYEQQADGTFKEVPGAAGLDDPGFGHGVAIGDIDNDGDYDVYVTNYGPDSFYRNDGGKFVNATKEAGFAGDKWSSSVGFFDYDRDGYLDLYVAHFATFNPNKKCAGSDNPEDLDYCGPHMFPAQMDALYHNNGDGTFTDVTTQAGIREAGRGWGVAFADFTGDGWCDVYVANDEEPAQLWINQTNGTFVEEAVIRGCAYNMAGKVEAGMGVGIGDIDGDHRFDLFKTHIASETNTLYLSGQAGDPGFFIDQTSLAGMGVVDRPYTGWGTGFLDYDHDGDLDIAVANGRVSKGPVWAHAALGSFWNRFAEPKLLFENDGTGRFTDISSKTGKYGTIPEVTRGLAFGDLDADGDVDMVANNLDNTLRIYRNDAPKGNNRWLIVRTMTGKRDAYGAEVAVEAGGKKFVRLAHPAYSFLSSCDPRAHFGLGAADKIDSLVVKWPSGKSETFAAPKVDSVITVTEGQGQSVE